MELRDIDKQILSLINAGVLPQSTVEIGEQLGITRTAVMMSMKKLEDEGLITRAGNSKTRQYYIPVKALRKIDSENLEQIDKEINDLTADAKDQYTDIKEKTEDLEKHMKQFDDKMKQFYVNIISIMAVFVAIFALININIKVVADVASTISVTAILTCIIIDVSALVLVGGMLLILKLLIINPLKNGGEINGKK